MTSAGHYRCSVEEREEPEVTPWWRVSEKQARRKRQGQERKQAKGTEEQNTQ